MTEQTDYRIANLKQKELKLRSQRHDILKSDSQTALSMILDAPAPATLIQSFPDQDLYYLMHKIGPDDFIPVLSLATSTQWEYIMDVDVWQDDRLDVQLMTKVFDVLFKADPQRLLRWVITEKPDFYEFYLLKNMDITVREHDEPPPSDFDDYITIDDKFYFRFPNKPRITDDQMLAPGDNQEAWELIETMLKSVAEMDLSVFHALMLETKALMPAETEEEQFRLKNIRLAEKGFLPPHDAIGIYQPVDLEAIEKRPSPLLDEDIPFDPDIPLPPQFFSNFLQGDNLFVSAVKLFGPGPMFIIESELAALINKVISADRIRLRSKENLETAISKTCSYLNLGLEIFIKKAISPEKAKQIIETYFLEDIFRTGSRAGIKLKTTAFNWFKNSFMQKNNLPLSFLDQTYMGVIGGLLIDRPLFFDVKATSDYYRNFASFSDIIQTRTALEEIMALDSILGNLDINISSFSTGMLTYKTMILTLWAKDRLDLEHNLEAIQTDIFKDFFIALFETDNKDIQLSDLMLWIQEITGISSNEIPNGFQRVLDALIKEIEDEYSTVAPDDIDPRYIPHFLLTKNTND